MSPAGGGKPKAWGWNKFEDFDNSRNLFISVSNNNSYHLEAPIIIVVIR
jgi:hypothetical protein